MRYVSFGKIINSSIVIYIPFINCFISSHFTLWTNNCHCIYLAPVRNSAGIHCNSYLRYIENCCRELNFINRGNLRHRFCCSEPYYFPVSCCRIFNINRINSAGFKVFINPDCIDRHRLVITQFDKLPWAVWHERRPCFGRIAISRIYIRFAKSLNCTPINFSPLRTKIDEYRGILKIHTVFKVDVGRKVGKKYRASITNIIKIKIRFRIGANKNMVIFNYHIAVITIANC